MIMSILVKVDHGQIEKLDLFPIMDVIDNLQKVGGLISAEQQVKFEINYSLSDTDPREFSEVPEIRLWFVALDAKYPWLPFLLDWREGELARYGAMLVPHEFKRGEGIVYNSEALDILIMGKVFVLYDWLKDQGISGNSRLKAMAQIFGYDLDDGFFGLLR